MEFKRCAMCGRMLPISEFTKNLRNKDGLHSYCKSCNAKKAKEFRESLGKDYINRYSMRQRESGYFRYGRGAYLNMKRSSAKRGIEFYLTEDSLREWWLSHEDKCFYCGCNLEEYLKICRFIEEYNGDDSLILYIKNHVFNKPNYYHIKSMTIDRVDSNGPYAVDNIVKSCWICNSIKSNNVDAKKMKIIGKENLKKIREVMELWMKDKN